MQIDKFFLRKTPGEDINVVQTYFSGLMVRIARLNPFEIESIRSRMINSALSDPSCEYNWKQTLQKKKNESNLNLKKKIKRKCEKNWKNKMKKFELI